MAIHNLNSTIEQILGKAGVTAEHMSAVEVAAGKVGEVNFNHAKAVANEFTGLIRFANNMAGHFAMSEEFSHLMVGVHRDSPLVQRAINYLKNEEAAREVLGDKYDQYYEEYNGDTDRLAEEAAGHMLREQFLNQAKQPTKTSLFRRVRDYISNLFKGINPGHYQDSIDSVKRDLSQLASDIITRKKPLTKEQIMQAARDAKFNALT